MPNKQELKKRADKVLEIISQGVQRSEYMKQQHIYWARNQLAINPFEIEADFTPSPTLKIDATGNGLEFALQFIREYLFEYRGENINVIFTQDSLNPEKHIFILIGTLYMPGESYPERISGYIFGRPANFNQNLKFKNILDINKQAFLVKNPNEDNLQSFDNYQVISVRTYITTTYMYEFSNVFVQPIDILNFLSHIKDGHTSNVDNKLDSLKILFDDPARLERIKKLLFVQTNDNNNNLYHYAVQSPTKHIIDLLYEYKETHYLLYQPNANNALPIQPFFNKNYFKTDALKQLFVIYLGYHGPQEAQPDNAFHNSLLGISYLNLSGINLQNKLGCVLRIYRSNKSRLISLNISATSLDENDFNQLNYFLKKYKGLQELFLNDNHFGGSSPRKSLKDYIDPSKLEWLLLIALNDYINLKKLSLLRTFLNDTDAQVLIKLLDRLEAFPYLRYDTQSISYDQCIKLEEARIRAMGRAELLGYDVMESELQFTNKINQLSSRFWPQQLNQAEEKADNDDLWGDLVDLTKKALTVFVPTQEKDRKNYIKNKLSYKPANRFDGLKFRATIALEQLDKLPLEESRDQKIQKEAYAELQNIWLGFMLTADLEANLLAQHDENNSLINPSTINIPFAIDKFLTCYKICTAAYEAYDINENGHMLINKLQAVEWGYNCPEQYNYPQFHWFRACFYLTLNELYLSSILHERFKIEKKPTSHAQILQDLKQLVFAGLLGIPAVGGLGSMLMHGGSALFKSLEHMIILPEFAHALELLHSGTEFAETWQRPRHFIHAAHSGINSITESAYEAIFQKKWLSSKNRFENIAKSFANDFSSKVEGIILTFAGMFESGLNILSNESAGLWGKACAKHFSQALMLGIMLGKKSGYPILPLQSFISLAIQWLAYIPMESPPLLKLRSGGYISTDVLLRGAALQCFINGTKEIFHWSSFEIKPLNPYLGKTPFAYQSLNMFVNTRWADESEVQHLIMQLNADIDENKVVMGEQQGENVAELSLMIDKKVLTALRRYSITSVTTKAVTYTTEIARLITLEKKVVRLEDRVDNLEKQLENYRPRMQ